MVWVTHLWVSLQAYLMFVLVSSLISLFSALTSDFSMASLLTWCQTLAPAHLPSYWILIPGTRFFFILSYNPSIQHFSFLIFRSVTSVSALVAASLSYVVGDTTSSSNRGKLVSFRESLLVLDDIVKRNFHILTSCPSVPCQMRGLVYLVRTIFSNSLYPSKNL